MGYGALYSELKDNEMHDMDSEIARLETENTTLRSLVEELERELAESADNQCSYHNQVIEQEAEIDRLREQVRWIPVEERLPEKDTTDIGEEYIVMLGCSYNLVAAMDYIDGDWLTNNTRWTRFVTHWMPLPQPPEVNNGR